MKKLFLYTAFGLLMSCHPSKQERQLVDPATPVLKPGQTYTDTLWYPAFRDLQAAWASKDKKRVAKYFEFPILSDENYIWALSGADYQPETDPKTGDTRLIPFTESHFNRYFDALFPDVFIYGLSKVDVKGLTPGESKTYDVRQTDSVQYVFTVELDSAATELHLLLESRFRHKNSVDTADDDYVRSMVGYTFHILGRRGLRFQEVGLAD
jgi:hypothetical protein